LVLLSRKNQLAEVKPGWKQVGAFQPDPYPGEDLLLLRAFGGGQRRAAQERLQPAAGPQDGAAAVLGALPAAGSGVFLLEVAETRFRGGDVVEVEAVDQVQREAAQLAGDGDAGLFGHIEQVVVGENGAGETLENIAVQGGEDVAGHLGRLLAI